MSRRCLRVSQPRQRLAVCSRLGSISAALSGPAFVPSRRDLGKERRLTFPGHWLVTEPSSRRASRAETDIRGTQRNSCGLSCSHANADRRPCWALPFANNKSSAAEYLKLALLKNFQTVLNQVVFRIVPYPFIPKLQKYTLSTFQKGNIWERSEDW